jgi:hypothetical protein
MAMISQAGFIRIIESGSLGISHRFKHASLLPIPSKNRQVTGLFRRKADLRYSSDSSFVRSLSLTQQISY